MLGLIKVGGAGIYVRKWSNKYIKKISKFSDGKETQTLRLPKQALFVWLSFGDLRTFSS